MRYIPNTEEEKREMLNEIGVSSFEDLIRSVPRGVRFKGRLSIPEAISISETGLRPLSSFDIAGRSIFIPDICSLAANSI